MHKPLQKKFHVKKGDEVVVISGAERGKRGRIIAVLRKKQRVIVEGVKMIKRHQRKSPQYPQGGIIEREGSIHISNVMLASRYDARAAKRAARAATPAA
jgi:large subunit ribosomal protein L24